MKNTEIRDDNLKNEVIKSNHFIYAKLVELDIHPVMLVITAIIGTEACMILTIFVQKKIYDNAKRLISSVLLIICLMSYTFELVGVHLMRIGNKDKLITKVNKEVKKLGQLQSVKLAIEEQKRINAFSRAHREIVTSHEHPIAIDDHLVDRMLEPIVVEGDKK